VPHRLLLLTTVGVLAACSPARVRLSAPPATASVAERAAAYERMRALHVPSPDVLIAADGTVVNASRFLQLADGTRVYHPSDLEPVVATDSPTARAIREHREATASVRRWRNAAFIAIAASLLVSAAGLALWSADDSDAGKALAFGGLIGTSVAPLGLLATLGPEAEADDARLTAFLTYDPSLRAAMRLCAEGRQVVECPPASAPPAAPASGP
jgi:hypothetical protein